MDTVNQTSMPNFGLNESDSWIVETSVTEEKFEMLNGFLAYWFTSIRATD